MGDQSNDQLTAIEQLLSVPKVNPMLFDIREALGLVPLELKRGL
jgi:hypothetical protein